MKKIEVKGITLQNLLGSNAYIYFDGIVLSKNSAPQARMEVEVRGANDTRRQIRKFSHGDSLFEVTKLPVYKEFVITDIKSSGSISLLMDLNVSIISSIAQVAS